MFAVVIGLRDRSTIALTLLLVLAGPAVARGDFFPDSQRVDMPASGPVASAIAQVGYLGRYCTGFFVKNTGNKLYLASARHCAEFNFKKACAAGMISVKTHAGQFAGVCDQVVAIDPAHDAVIFEAKFADAAAVQKQITYLTMSTELVMPASGQLQMFGFPNDRGRRGLPTVSVNCWANDGRDDSIFYESLGGGSTTPPLDAQTAYVRKNENMIGYNCDVYGGNSGGPIVKANTSVVVGMPATYFPNRYEIVPKGYSAYLFSLDRFIATNKSFLERAGIVWLN